MNRGFWLENIKDNLKHLGINGRKILKQNVMGAEEGTVKWKNMPCP
jgi:hypothetical protein